jgi:hypothetical protein
MLRDERGIALVLVLLCATLFLALSGALVAVMSTETTISATFREASVALGAADAAVVRVIDDLAIASDIRAAFSGNATSTFRDGAVTGTRPLPDGTTLDLLEATNVERCGASHCTDSEIDAITAERPWGVNNPRWQVYGSGWLSDIAPAAGEAARVYLVVWIGDDGLETDGDPFTDAADVDAAGHEVALLRVAAYGAYSVRRRIEVVARREEGTVRLTSWREIR